MEADDPTPRRKLPDLVLGEDISALSAHELEARIKRLEDEIARSRAEIQARGATRSAAEQFFKR